MHKLAVVTLFALAACKSQPDVEARNASVAEDADKVAEASASGDFVRPGNGARTSRSMRSRCSACRRRWPTG